MAAKPRKKHSSVVHTGSKGPACPIWEEPITSIAKFHEVCSSILGMGKRYWFRGQANINWLLTPSALRYKTSDLRNKALNLLREFKRCSTHKLGNEAPHAREKLKWIQIAQHYGVPTRLLDWTERNTVALFFACCNQFEQDGAVFILNPIDLNREFNPRLAKILDPDDDERIINDYLILDGSVDSNGNSSIAISPVWNSERIQQQQGVFTIQGSRHLSLTNKHAPSLVCLRIKKEYKESILRELDRAGCHEMSIYPDLDHMSQYLKWREGL